MQIFGSKNFNSNLGYYVKKSSPLNSNLNNLSYKKRVRASIKVTNVFGNITTLEKLSQENNIKNSRAVVIGGGFSGLITSKVLSKHFQEVVVLERDEITASEFHAHANQLPDDLSTVNRKGVPHYTQPHQLFAGGFNILEQIFSESSFKEEMQQKGAVVMDITTQQQFYYGSKLSQKIEGDESIMGLGCSRHLLETVIRNRISMDSNITLFSGISVDNIVINKLQNQVQGVILKQGIKIGADLVVDASGKLSKTSDWLKQAGFETPSVTKIDAHLRYGTRVYQLSKPLPNNIKMIVNVPTPCQDKIRTGIILPIEGNRIQLVMAGYNNDAPPVKNKDYLKWISEFAFPDVYEAVSQATPLTPVSPYGGTSNIIKSYHKINMPKGLCVIGDAVVCLDPVMGMGMVTFIQEVQALDSCLQACHQNKHFNLNQLSQNIQKELYKAARFSWLLCGIGDSQLPFARIEGGQKEYLQPNFLEKYYQTAFVVGSQDARVGYATLRVTQMVDEPIALFHPRVVARVLWYIVMKFLENQQNAVVQFQNKFLKTDYKTSIN